MNLPNVFQNKKIEIKDTPQELFYGNRIIPKETEKKDIKTTIKNLFQSKNYVYKLDVLIETKNNTLDTSIVGQTNNHLITINNELIPIRDIIDIYEKKKN
ncbi:MAG: hypothetical protein OSJ70_09530 [Bacilli bacterium]|nr:hypothetical protein [Bacilli bacterium]